jgi:hypothetical protein
MKPDPTPGRSDARDTASGPPGIRPHWRAAANLHAALFAGDVEPAPAPGEIWTIRHPTDPDAELVLVVIAALSGATATIVPLSATTDYATEWDLVLPIATLGYPAMAQPKLVGALAAARLEGRLSELMPESHRDLERILAAAEAGQTIPPERVPVGPWVLSERDPRLAARIQAAEHLAAYVTVLGDDPVSEWRSLGSILMRGSRATGVDLAAVLDEPRWVGRLEADQLNPFAMLPARKMALLLKTLRIGWTDRVRDAIYQLASKFAASDVPHGTVFGRRQGTRARRVAASSSPAGATDKAGEYVDDVEREFKGL